uniref:L3MBTL histone methyl-lysine binding protein 3 n=1 Tax=Callorhinchus milii TaxID=7868 RepID=A0A4W3I4R9_CALMI
TTETATDQDFDVFSAMDWKDGIATLPGSDLKFRINEFGALEIITDEAEVERIKKASATKTWNVPIVHEVLAGNSAPTLTTEEAPSMDGILCCENCGHYGTPEEFSHKGKFCGVKSLTFDGKRKVWCWASYLEEEKATAAPTKLFKEYQSFPQSKNGFKVGLKLEGVDPEHPSMYCALTVAEVCGYRIRLHFDRYSDCYDFWVNVDSPDIHPVGWCEKTGHKLHPPKVFFLKKVKITKHRKKLFKHTIEIMQSFRVGMKLEAVDKKNPTFICVATVADMVDNRFLMHFDNWDESYDYWCDATSPYIHPIGWCQEHGKSLTPPPGYHDPKRFSWDKYLEETSSLPAPARAFKSRPPHGFQPNMKFEVVDKRNPMLIRVATILDVDDHRIKVHFDGWNHDYDYWIDADSPDIHPAGWCAKIGHPLQPPISPLELVDASEQGGCPTPGCKGIGHIKGVKHSGHHSAIGCPYSEINLNRESVMQDRLNGEMPLSSPGMPKNKKLEADRTETTPTVECKIASDSEKKTSHVCAWTILQALHQSVFLSSVSPVPSLPLCWEQHSKLLPGVAGITARKVVKWTINEVSEFILSLPGCEEQAKAFREEQIDGEAFLLLTQTDIVKIMSIKLGPALKIYNSILMFKTAEENGQNEL